MTPTKSEAVDGHIKDKAVANASIVYNKVQSKSNVMTKVEGDVDIPIPLMKDTQQKEI